MSVETPPIKTQPSRIKKSFNPIDWFTNWTHATRVWFVVSAICVAMLFIQPYFVIQAEKQRENVVIVDGAGTFFRSPLLGYEEADKLHDYIVNLACISMFQRNPNGIDYPELLGKVYRPDALAQAKRDIAQQDGEFKSKTLYQHAIILSYKTLNADQDTAIVTVRGQLVQVGTVDGEKFSPDPVDFIAKFELVRNPDMTQNGRFPMAVNRFKVQPLVAAAANNDAPASTP